MRKMIREISEHVTLYRDDKSGIAWIEDGNTGCGVSAHPNISSSGSVRGMKDLGYWRKSDRVVRSHGFAYNIDILAVDKNDPLEKLVASECRCAACMERY